MIQKVISQTDIIDSPLARGNPRSSIWHRLTLERGKSHSSVDRTLPEVLQTRSSLERQTTRLSGRTKSKVHARASKLPLERTKTYRGRYWEIGIHARASKRQLEWRSNNEGPARASKSPLEREGQILGINSRFLSSTNLFQTYPTQPKTQVQRVKACNQNKTTTNLRNRVRIIVKQQQGKPGSL